jgi:transposase
LAAVACGIDWAEGHHDLAIVDEEGAVIVAERIDNDAAGLSRLLSVLDEQDPGGEPLPVAIETSTGLLVAGLRAAGRTVFAINPLAVSRYRDRYRTSGGKSLRVLTRAQQDAVWERTELTNRIRCLLKTFFPTALNAFERGGKHQLHSPACRTILAMAPTPEAARALTASRLAAALRRAGRTRSISGEAGTLKQFLHGEQMHQLPHVEQAMGVQLRGLIRQLDAVCATVIELEAAVEDAFGAHPDAAVVSSFPGLGPQLAARMLAEIGDDKTRFTDGRALKAFAGAAPVTRASGKSRYVHARRAKNDRIAAAGYVWALAAVRHDPQWEARYRARRAAGDRHVTALRKMFNTMLGKLHHCLTTGQHYQPELAFATLTQTTAA